MPVELDTEETERELSRGLPDFMPRGKESGNRLLLRPAASELDDVATNIQHAEMAVQIQRAETIGQLREIGKELETLPQGSESVEHYRARLLAESQLMTSKGTISDVIGGAATVLGIEPENIDYNEPISGSTENGTASLGVPSSALDSSDLTESEIASYVDKFASVGARIESIVLGTFTYITPNDYNAANFDATKAYDGLDTNGDPKDNGGTYAGVIN